MLTQVNPLSTFLHSGYPPILLASLEQPPYPKLCREFKCEVTNWELELRTGKTESGNGEELPGGAQCLLELSLQLAHPIVGHLQLQLAHLEGVACVGYLQLGLIYFACSMAEHLLARGVQGGLLPEPLLGQVHHFFSGSVYRLGFLVIRRCLLRLFGQLGGINARLVVRFCGVD